MVILFLKGVILWILYGLILLKILEKEQITLSKLGYNSTITQNTSLPFSVEGALEFKNQAHFTQLKYIYGLRYNFKGESLYDLAFKNLESLNYLL